MFGSGITNSGLLNITKSLSTEFGEDNILVNAICPGWVDTNLWRRNAQGLAADELLVVGQYHPNHAEASVS
jgi:3-oxoacyl-[acyl-carrier protein] reductase